MTPCEEKGYKVGDEFVVTEDTTFQKGARVRLSYDDRTGGPKFTGIGCKAGDGEDWHYIYLDNVRKVGNDDSIITRTNGQPFATESSARQQLTAKGLQGTHEVVSHEGGYALVPKQADAERAAEQPTMTANPITTLIQARQARDEAEKAYQEALEEARECLGEGFELTEVGIDAASADRLRKSLAAAMQIPERMLLGDVEEDMTDPANWREGDVVEWTGYTGKYFTRGNTYKINSPDSPDDDFSVIDDEGDDHSWDFGPAMGCFRFHHRPA